MSIIKFKIKRKLTKNGIYKIPHDISFIEETESLIIKQNLIDNFGNGNKLLSAILVYISHQYDIGFFSLDVINVCTYIINNRTDIVLYTSTQSNLDHIITYKISNFYLDNDILYRVDNKSEKDLLIRKLKINRLKNALNLDIS